MVEAQQIVKDRKFNELLKEFNEFTTNSCIYTNYFFDPSAIPTSNWDIETIKKYRKLKINLKEFRKKYNLYKQDWNLLNNAWILVKYVFESILLIFYIVSFYFYVTNVPVFKGYLAAFLFFIFITKFLLSILINNHSVSVRHKVYNVIEQLEHFKELDKLLKKKKKHL